MSPPRRAFLNLSLAAAFISAGVSPVAAQNDWKSNSGVYILNSFLNGTGVPDGAGVVAGQVEALSIGSFFYLPHLPGSGTGTHFMGKTFTDATGDGGGVSGHAEAVGKNFYSNTLSMCAGLTDVRSWSFGDFIGNVLRGAGGQVTQFAPDVANFSFAFSYQDPNDSNNVVRRMDHLVNASTFIAIVGIDNVSGTTMSDGFAPCYNVISVGRTDGNHASGDTPATVDGPGRTKPEVVADHFVTSYAAGAVSSMTSALYSAAPAAAQRSEVMKAIVMAGATKEEFPAWDKTDTRPIDEVFGAGEMNVFHSYRILTGGDQVPGAVPRRGWDLLPLENLDSETYTFTIDPGATEGEFSLMATWNRTLDYVDPRGPSPGAYEPDPLPNVDIEFQDVTGAVIQRSVSLVDNVEHIYFPSLPPGTYTLTVSTDLAAEVALAWRTELQHVPRLVKPVAPVATIGMDNLVSGGQYEIERSTNFTTWSLRDTVTAGSPFEDWTDPSAPSPRAFYRASPKWTP